MVEIETVGIGKGTLCHGQVPYSIHQVGLPFPVVSRDAIDIRGERNFLERYVPEILDDYFFKYRHR